MSAPLIWNLRLGSPISLARDTAFRGNADCGTVAKPIGFFNLGDHLKRLSDAGNPLLVLAQALALEAFRGLFGCGSTETSIAHELASKYADHLPLYQQAQIMSRHGNELDKSTLADRVGLVA